MTSWKEHYWYKVPVTRARIEEMIRRVKILGPKTVLEVGCNEGFLSQALIEEGFKVTAVDIDLEMIARAKEMFGIEVIRADAHSLPFVNDSFDLVVGGEILEHLINPGVGLGEMFRVSKDKVLVSLPVGEYWLGEPTHRWQINASVIEHDEGKVEVLEKKVLVLEFSKRGGK